MSLGGHTKHLAGNLSPKRSHLQGLSHAEGFCPSCLATEGFRCLEPPDQASVSVAHIR